MGWSLNPERYIPTHPIAQDITAVISVLPLRPNDRILPLSTLLQITLLVFLAKFVQQVNTPAFQQPSLIWRHIGQEMDIQGLAAKLLLKLKQKLHKYITQWRVG